MQDSKGVSAPGGAFVCLGVFLELYSKLSYSSHRRSKCLTHLPKDSFNNYQITIYLALLIMGNAISINTTDKNQTKG